jgi:glycosyltransferase involved in cell wall biosynthesis
VLDPELRTRMERLAQHRASLFTWDRTARKTLDVYYEIAGGKAAAAVRARRAVPMSRP